MATLSCGPFLFSRTPSWGEVEKRLCFLVVQYLKKLLRFFLEAGGFSNLKVSAAVFFTFSSDYREVRPSLTLRETRHMDQFKLLDLLHVQLSIYITAWRPRQNAQRRWQLFSVIQTLILVQKCEQFSSIVRIYISRCQKMIKHAYTLRLKNTPILRELPAESLFSLYDLLHLPQFLFQASEFLCGLQALRAALRVSWVSWVRVTSHKNGVKRSNKHKTKIWDDMRLLVICSCGNTMQYLTLLQPSVDKKGYWCVPHSGREASEKQYQKPVNCPLDGNQRQFGFLPFHLLKCHIKSLWHLQAADPNDPNLAMPNIQYLSLDLSFSIPTCAIRPGSCFSGEFSFLASDWPKPTVAKATSSVLRPLPQLIAATTFLRRQLGISDEFSSKVP